MKEMIWGWIRHQPKEAELAKTEKMGSFKWHGKLGAHCDKAKKEGCFKKWDKHLCWIFPNI